MRALLTIGFCALCSLLYGQSTTVANVAETETYTYNGLVMSPLYSMFAEFAYRQYRSELHSYNPADMFWICVDSTMNYYSEIEKGIYITSDLIHLISSSNFLPEMLWDILHYGMTSEKIKFTVKPNDFREILKHGNKPTAVSTGGIWGGDLPSQISNSTNRTWFIFMKCEFHYVKILDYTFEAANLHAKLPSDAFVKYPRIDINYITKIVSCEHIELSDMVVLPPVPDHLELFSGYD